MNRLGLEVSKGKQQEEESKAQLETQKVLDLKEEMHVHEEENGSILQEAATVSKLSSVFESFAAEKVEELESFSLHFPEVL
ncbi:hypothetical protein OIU79_003879 [Salix purpurea]|uniref:Uncharacterized protein n=1 Tax=Salix purpurea TaxID=77065 RepID=A0A9Q0U8W4_SALPP|nr:hypothetical protein OIU79_003879 [Salix purpurea]